MRLGTYKGIHMTRPNTEVTKHEVLNVLKKKQKEYAVATNIDDRSAQEGDQVILDFQGMYHGQDIPLSLIHISRSVLARLWGAAKNGRNSLMVLVNTDYISGKELEMLGMVKGSTIQCKNIGRDIAVSYTHL